MWKRKRLHLGKAIKDALIVNKMTQKELADKMGVNKSLVTRWIKEDQYSISTALKLAHTLFMDPHVLIDEIVDRHIEEHGLENSLDYFLDVQRRRIASQKHHHKYGSQNV